MSRFPIGRSWLPKILLALYLALLAGLYGMAYWNKLPRYLPPGNHDMGDGWLPFTILTTLISQTIFILSAGTKDLCRPVRKKRIILPVIIAGGIMTLMLFGLCSTLYELFERHATVETWLVWGLLGANWIGWSIAFFLWSAKQERFRAQRNIIAVLIGGSLLELIVAIPSHIVVSRRPGCLVGIGTGIGIMSGLAVMLWSFGPGIILLFLREIRRKEEGSGCCSNNPSGVS